MRRGGTEEHWGAAKRRFDLDGLTTRMARAGSKMHSLPFAGQLYLPNYERARETSRYGAILFSIRRGAATTIRVSDVCILYS